MKIRFLVTVVTLFFAVAATASAFQWHLSYGQAKHASKEFAEGLCEEDRECAGWGVGQCHRQSESHVDCAVGVFYEDFFGPGEEAECDIILHWGVSRSGYVTLKNYGHPHCHRN